MSLDKFIRPKEIKKIVDPGLGNDPFAGLLKTSTTQEDATTPQDIAETSVNTIIQDLIEEAQLTQSEVYEAIDSIASDNEGDPLFDRYHKLVKENHFNPKVLIENPKARPEPLHDPNVVKKAERNVYRNSFDPRAAFMQDLYNNVTEAGLSEYLLKNYWSNIVNSNPLYDQFDYLNSTVFLALDKEKQQLLQVRDATARIQINTVERLSFGFVRTFADRLITDLNVINTTETVQKLDSIIKSLNQIRTVFSIINIVNGEYWEQFSSNLLDIYGDTLKLVSSRVVRLTAYPVVFGVQNALEDLIETFGEVTGIENIAQVAEVNDFTMQLNGCFTQYMSEIEGDLVLRENTQLKLEENRQVMILNSQKNSKTLQFTKMIDSFISYLADLRNVIATTNERAILDLDIASQKAISTIDTVIRKNKNSSKIGTPGINSTGDI